MCFLIFPATMLLGVFLFSTLYHFSNKMNMLLQIVAGRVPSSLKLSALPDNATVRDYLKPNEISLLAVYSR